MKKTVIKKEPEKKAPAKKPIVKTKPLARKPVLRLGDKGADVTLLQVLLAKKGSKIKATGVFNIGTRSAVCAFQRKCVSNGLKGIVVSGVVDAKTWNALTKTK